MPAVSTTAPRRKAPLVAHRRGRKVEHDEEGGAASEESYSDDSGLSEASVSDDSSEDEDDEDEEVVNDVAAGVEKLHVANGTGFPARPQTDTEVMENGLRDKKKLAELEVVDFEEMGSDAEAETETEAAQETKSEPAATTKQITPEVATKPQAKTFESPLNRQRREHEEYKKRRSEDPAFVPNRGRFFMHDHREGNGSNGFKPFAPGGRGRGGRHADFHQPPPPPELASAWKHDMHEQVETQARPAATQGRPNPPQQQFNHNPAPGRQKAPEQPRSFGRTFQRGNVQIQVRLPGMEAPITFSEVPSKVYTRLPFHRPPLRRDKPVRIALPNVPVRYIYPSQARSFIFIPRAMRPGGSGYIRGAGHRGRGGYPTGGRNSMYGGGGSTIYSPSVGMSRRSSFAYDTPHTPLQHMHSAAQQPYLQDTQTRPQAAEDESTRPIVRLPSAASSVPNGPANAYHQPPTPRNAPSNQPPQPPPSYTPSAPYREARATPKIPMYQPRPQKAVNVAEIDSPHVMHFPQNYSGGVYTENVPSGTPVMNNSGYAPQHSRHPSYPSQASGTPLSQIPEAVHARPFHPANYAPPPPQQGYYQPYPQHHPQPQHLPPQPHGGFHPPPPPYVAASPVVFTPQPPMQQAPPPAPAAGPTTIAQESNGMVYYSTVDPMSYQPSPVPAVTYAHPYQQQQQQQQYPTPGPQDMGGTVYYYPPPQQQYQQPMQGNYPQ